MDHYKQVCEKCHTIMNQCRCMAIDKKVTYGVCDKCMSSDCCVSDAAATPEPMPTEGNVEVLPFVIQDLKARSEFGFKKYGTVLKTNNGRDSLMDAYQEQLDLIMYLKQELLEREEEENYKLAHEKF